MKNFGEIPVLTTPQMAEVDRLMIEEYHILLIQMMENAGRNLAELARRQLGGQVDSRSVVILSGAGNNGGGGLVAARHLSNWGAEVSVKLAFNQARLKDIPAHQWQILKVMGLGSNEDPELDKADLIIDALIGYGLTGDPRPPVAEWIDRANDSGRPILALDAPSGLNTTSGIPGKPCIQASTTMTLALPKTGLLTSQAKTVIGDLYLADISVPPELYRHLGIEVPNLFENDAILKVN
ncbi:NAD(P)H-hydrate epimerase [Chloroflexota bacterium]